MYVYGTCLFYVCCSDCVEISGKVCCVAAVVKSMNRVILSGFSMRLFCFVQAKTLCR